MTKLGRIFSQFVSFSGVVLLASLLLGCSNTEQHIAKVNELEKEKAILEFKIKEIQLSHQKTLAVKDSEIARLTELNKSLDTQIKEL
jgi:hypothetical protein